MVAGLPSIPLRSMLGYHRTPFGLIKIAISLPPVLRAAMQCSCGHAQPRLAQDLAKRLTGFNRFVPQPLIESVSPETLNIRPQRHHATSLLCGPAFRLADKCFPNPVTSAVLIHYKAGYLGRCLRRERRTHEYVHPARQLPVRCGHKDRVFGVAVDRPKPLYGFVRCRGISQLPRQSSDVFQIASSCETDGRLGTCQCTHSLCRCPGWGPQNPHPGKRSRNGAPRYSNRVEASAFMRRN